MVLERLLCSWPSWGIFLDAFDATPVHHSWLEAENLAAKLPIEEQNRLVMSGLDLHQ
ncbi:MAG: hypothetical protein PVJ19_05290 [Desulfobacteraceae bacterium]|jgi:hypothetical protein